MNRYRLYALCALLATLPMQAGSDTVRSRASDHFDRIRWTTSPDTAQPAAIAGTTIPGGNETYASLVLSSSAGSSGIYPRIEGLGELRYDGIDSGLVSLLTGLCESLGKKEVPESLLSRSRQFLATISNYRLERVPDPDHVFFSRPEGESPELRNATIAIHTTDANGKHGVLFLYVETVFEKGLWKISDIIFDSESYASVTIKN